MNIRPTLEMRLRPTTISDRRRSRSVDTVLDRLNTVLIQPNNTAGVCAEDFDENWSFAVDARLPDDSSDLSQIFEQNLTNHQF